MNRTRLCIALAIIIAAAVLALAVPRVFPPHPPHTALSAISPPAPDYDPAIAALIAEVNTSEITGTTSALQNFSTRKYGSPENREAAGYLFDRLAAIPGLSVEYQGGEYRNIIATLPGKDPDPATVFIIGAHYDSAARDGGDDAPGATDNGCGTAIVLEAARVMSRHDFNRTIVFALWNAEEEGFEGSADFARRAARESRDIALYYNIDSACYDPEDSRVLDIMSDDASAPVAGLAARANTLYGLQFTLTSNRFSCMSDHTAFRSAGYPAIATHSPSHGPAGTREDTIDKVSPAFATKNAQLGVAVIAGMAGIQP